SVLPNFVQEKYYHQDYFPSTDQLLKIVSVGNLRKEKNHETLILAMQQLPDMELEIIGDGPERTKLESLVTHAGISNVNFLGAVKNVPETISRAHIFVMPSKFEGFGIALGEAMALGMPCIASDIPVFKELGKDSLIYFNPFELSSLVESIDLLRNADLRKAYGAKSREQAKEFNEESYIAKLKIIYTNLDCGYFGN
ncbi:MAG: glycosyltransferase family 4 protein, partial [Cryomorphaceae bacterium]